MGHSLVLARSPYDARHPLVADLMAIRPDGAPSAMALSGVRGEGLAFPRQFLNRLARRSKFRLG